MSKCVLMHFIISVFKLKLNCRLYTECICLAMQDIVCIYCCTNVNDNIVVKVFSPIICF